MKFKRYIDWFVPDHLQNDLVMQSKARIAVFVMFVFAIIMLPSSIRGLRIGRPDIAATTFSVSVLMFLSPFILKKTQSLPIASNIFIGVGTFFFAFVTVTRGGANSYFATNLLLVILTAFLISNLKSGVFWGFVVIVSLAMMKVAEANGYSFGELTYDTAHINLMVVILVVTIIGGIYEWNSSRNLKLLDLGKRQSEEASDSLKDVLEETNTVMEAVAGGDLSKTIQSDVEGDLAVLKTSVNSALEMLGADVLQVLSICSEINNGSGELSSASQSLASGATEQAASLEEISSSMTEIGSKAKTNDENATQAQQLSNQTVEELSRGNVQMDNMLEAMQTISETSTNVAKVIKVIDEIAFQTNLLALNAAVEAARAGKYGKGFAVVADEVRNLAARSAEAAKDTTHLIEDSIKQVENGVNSAKFTAETLKGFVESIRKVNDIVGEISAASKEQSTSVTEINLSLAQVNDVVQSNSSISEESASSSEELSSQTEILENLMRKFVLTGNQQVTKPASVLVEKSSQLTLATSPKKALQESDPAKRQQIVLDDDNFGKY